MHLRIVYLKLIVFFIFSSPFMAFASDELVDRKITELLKPNWPHYAFLAIPRIVEMQPILAIEILEKDKVIKDLYCVQIRYFDQQKKFDPDAQLERESLHELLCKAMKRAVEKTSEGLIVQNFPYSSNIALTFDFFNGSVSVIEMPYPPLDPMTKLENIFLDESADLNFGDIEFPEELELEIKQTPL